MTLPRPDPQALESQLLALQETTAALSSRLEAVEREQQALTTWARAMQEAHEATQDSLRDLYQRIAEIERWLAPLLVFFERVRVAPDPELLELEHFDSSPGGRVLGYRQAGAAVEPGQDYVAFEDLWRLSEDVIRERQRPYLALVGGRPPVLDAGCGRGEFLELLRDAGVRAHGVDQDEGMVARARLKGLDIKHEDLVSHLEGLDDGSLGAVFSAQVIEHLTYSQLLAFLRAAHRKLQPGGLLIAETVNPHSPAALKNFWIDLTHNHPVFPEMLLTTCRSIGFGSAYVFHPGGSGDVDRDRYACGDFAVVAERTNLLAD